MVKDDSIVIFFRKNQETKGFAGPVSYKWWGTHDNDYPNLITEVEKDRFSFINVVMDVVPMDILNFPDMSDAEDIPLKSEYIEDGHTEEEWWDLFDDVKRTHFGLLALPIDANDMEVRAFFFDYAFCDKDHNGTYSPPRLCGEEGNRDYKDYDIVEMATAPEAEIYINGVLAGVTDAFGKLIVPHPSGEGIISAKYHGNNEYEAKLCEVHMPLKKAFIIFSEESY
jgi:hypothetical protein